ncbi:MAG TPA: hypothetical protein VGE57_11600 [Solimonas sp.]
MGILKRLKQRIDRLGEATDNALAFIDEHKAFEAAIPVGKGGEPLWRIRVQMLTEPQADGERVRLRAHIQTNFASALRPALRAESGAASDPMPALTDATAGRGKRLAARAGQLAQRTAQRALAVPVVGLLMEPLLRLDLNTWVEVQTSTASLDAGSHDLLPQADKLAALGIQPRRAGEQPVAESWAGEAPDGFAQVSVLQFDKRHLPIRLQQALGNAPFSLAAAIVNTAQQK